MGPKASTTRSRDSRGRGDGAATLREKMLGIGRQPPAGAIAAVDSGGALRPFGIAGLAVVATVVLAAMAFWVARGSAVHDALLAAALLLPLMAYFALSRPIAFPYCAYILLIPFDTFLSVGKFGTLTKLFGIVCGFLLLFYCLRTRRFAAPGPPLVLLGLLIGWMFVSAIWSLNPQATTTWRQTYTGLALLYAALCVTPVSLADFKAILFSTAVAFLIVAAIGVVDFKPAVDYALQGAEHTRVIVSFGNVSVDPNEYADAILFPLAIVMMLSLRSRYVIAKIAGLLASFTMVAAILVTGSREALVGLIIVALYYVIRSRYRGQLSIVLAVLATVSTPFTATLMARFQKALATGGAGRTSIWSVGLRAAKHYWMYGAGIGNFPTAYNQFYVSTAHGHLYGWNAPPHNVMLQFFVELGVVGLALFVAFIVANFLMLRAIPPDHPLYDYRIIVEGGLIAICATSVFIGSFNDKWGWLVFATAAQLTYVASTYRRVPAKPRSPAPT